jgi:hypothetical protein
MRRTQGFILEGGTQRFLKEEQQSGIVVAAIRFLETSNCGIKLGNMPLKLNGSSLLSSSSESYFINSPQGPSETILHFNVILD